MAGLFSIHLTKTEYNAGIQRRNPSGGSDASNPSDPAYRNETHRLIAKSIQENSMMKEASNSKAHFQTGIDFIDMANGFSAI